MQIGIFFIQTSVSITLIFLGIIFVLVNKKPTKINKLAGYRTRKSMLSQETWDFANKKLIQIKQESALKILHLIVIQHQKIM